MSIHHFSLRADFEVMDPQGELFQRDARNFKQNAAWNFSAYLAIWNPTFFRRLLFAGLQKECLRLGHLLSLADEHFRLPAEVMVPLLFPGLFAGDVLSGIYFVFEANFFMRSTYLRVGRMLLQQRGVDFRPFLTLQPDFTPFTTYIAFPEPTWVSIIQRFTLRGHFQVLPDDVPWTADFEGHALLTLISPRSSVSDTFSVAELILSPSAWPRLCTWHCTFCCTWFSDEVQRLYAHDDFRSVLESTVH